MSTFTRAPEHDRRIGRGDDFAGDAWRRPDDTITYTIVGGRPADGRTDAERAYDSQRDGSIYIKPEPRSAQFNDGYRDGLTLGAALIADDDQMIADWVDAHLPGAADELADGARRAIDLDFDRVVDRVFDLSDDQRRDAIALWQGFLSRVEAA